MLTELPAQSAGPACSSASSRSSTWLSWPVAQRRAGNALLAPFFRDRPLATHGILPFCSQPAQRPDRDAAPVHRYPDPLDAGLRRLEVLRRQTVGPERVGHYDFHRRLRDARRADRRKGPEASSASPRLHDRGALTDDEYKAEKALPAN